MFSNHLITKVNDEQVLYLFIDFNYEFSWDFRFKSTIEKGKTLLDHAQKYIKDKKIDFNKGKVFLVVGGLVIGSLLLGNYQYSDIKGSLEPKYQYNEQIDAFNGNLGNSNIFTTPKTNVATNKIEENKVATDTSTVTNTNAKEITPPQTSTTSVLTTNTSKSPTSNVKTSTTTAATSTTTNTKQSATTSTVTTTKPAASNTTTSTTVVSPTNGTTSTTPATTSTTANTVTTTTVSPAPEEKMVTLYRYNGTIETISLEDYVTGVVSAEMPASFSTEALKAQSILARTYALKKISQSQVLSDTTSNQVYKDTNQLKTMWGADFTTYYNKIKNAVTATKGEYLTYNGNYIEAVYHSTSNGLTEDAIAVWGNDYPYLKSVDSHWDLNASSYYRETAKEFSVISSIIGIDFNATTNVEVLSRTSSNRISQIKVGDKTFTGVELRNLLGLRSTDFDIKVEGDSVMFVTRGYGHGVGMSQYGANGMAKEGYTYRNILTHYYPGTQIKN